ncbi:MAG: CPBP family intramembrane metalloprotease [Treponema sp.]|jgi:membrane protease YdiL (CAAX protease family)|nr:CPBP family intramembrane metalloprotease [Treponema sp.]
MTVYIETIILYAVIFLSGQVSPVNGGEAADFSVSLHLARILMYCIPSLALIWYLVIKAKPVKYLGIVPGKADLLSFALSLPGLLLIGFFINFASIYLTGETAQPLSIPSTTAEWVILCASCIFAACLEESFFRYYILSRRKELRLGAGAALFFSVALFSVCHIYQGPWGFLNAVLSGTFLAFLFLRYKALYGIALAHGVYNIAAYAVEAWTR